MKAVKKKRKNHVKKRHTVSPAKEKSTYVQRTHKDTLFRFIFRDKRKLLELYNAINSTSYKDIRGLEVTTLENVIYLGYKNDISFLLDWMLYLIEHQSSWNPNIPLRGVLYFARLYKSYVDANGYDMYGTRRIPLPYPQYLVFYNGQADRPEREVIHLSEAYILPEGNREPPSLECSALILNINYGKNQELLSRCKPLLDYSRFIYYTREYMSEGNLPESAVDLAVERCLQEDVLTDVLKANRREVVSMFLEDYDEELHIRTLKEEGREEGLEEGLKEGADRINRLNEFLIRDNRMDELVRSCKDGKLQEALLKEYQL